MIIILIILVILIIIMKVINSNSNISAPLEDPYGKQSVAADK